MQIKHKHIIIGAGPAGIQCAYFLKKYNIKYIIIEKSDKVGSFFNKFPHSGKLISINKKNIESENNDFKLRHDWNSLLNDEGHLFTNYSDEFYPNRDDLYEYFNDFALNNDLNILFNKTVFKIVKQSDEYFIFIENSKDIFICDKLIIATGNSKPYIPKFVYNIKNMPQHYCEFEKDYFIKKQNLIKYEKKNVAIIGDGNSAYELANILLSYTNKTIILSKQYKNNWSISSHYAGGLRSNYFSFMDSFYLKSLNAISEFNICDENEITIYENEFGKYSAYNKNTNIFSFENMDKIILCTGWLFDSSIFDFNIDMDNKYPKIKNNFESVSHNNLFFIGSLMHSIDYKKGSGGFIHGFRYLINIFIKINFGIPFTRLLFTIPNDINNIVEYIIKRINTSSDLYQMFNTICDIAIFNKKENEIIYIENILDTMVDTNNDFYTFIIKLQYGKSTNTITELPTKKSFVGSESNASFLHPVITVKQNNMLIEIIHFDEDLFVEFTNRSIWYDRIIRLIKSYI